MGRFRREKNKSLKFTTEEYQKKKRMRLFLLAFFSFVVVFGGLSLFILGYTSGFDLNKMIGKPDDPEQTGTSDLAESVLPEMSGRATFLLACGSDDGKTLYLTALVGADMDQQLFSVYMLDPNAQAKEGSRSVSLQENYQMGGIGALRLAVADLTGIKADRYVYAAEKGFKAVLRALGNGVVLNVPSRIDYRGDDFTLRLQPGEQTLNADTLLKWIKYDGGGREAQLERQAQMLCAAFDQLINIENVRDADKLFKRIINEVDSDISMLDYTNHRVYLESLARSGQRKPSVRVSSVSSLSGEGA